MTLEAQARLWILAILAPQLPEAAAYAIALILFAALLVRRFFKGAGP